MTDQMADEEVVELGKLVATHEAYKDLDWKGIALVGDFAGGQRSMFGYVYLNDGDWEAKLPRDSGRTVMKALRQLHDAMAKKNDAAWQQCLLQIDHDSMSVNIKFEYDDPQRWSVTPANLEQMVAELRPS